MAAFWNFCPKITLQMFTEHFKKMFKKKLVKNVCPCLYFFSNLELLVGSFDQIFHKDFRDFQILSVTELEKLSVIIE